MEILDPKQPGVDEPADGWVTAPQLLDTVITSIALCRFSGDHVSVKDGCAVRLGGGHEDVECVSLYFQAEALASGQVVAQVMFPNVQAVTRTHSAGDDPIGTTS